MNPIIPLAAFLSLLVSQTLFGQDSMQVDLVMSGLNEPVFVTHAPDDPDRIFIVQRSGEIRIFDTVTNTLNNFDFLNVPNVFEQGLEHGLLGLVFHPDYQTNGYFYVFYTDQNFDSHIKRFSSIDPDTADPTSGYDIIFLDQNAQGHNGGWMDFGKDGYFYVAIGDAGCCNDNGTGHTPGIGNAQDITDNLFGKIIRIDLSSDDFPNDPLRNYAIPPTNPFVNVTGDDEIFLYGLRNPWGSSFDRLTGDLWIGDVGQGSREEIDLYLYGSNADRNYGWRLREGTMATPANNIGGARPIDNVEPVYEYPWTGPGQERCVIGGHVYRGPVADLQGQYFFGDWSSRRVWSLRYDGTTSFNGTNFTSLREWTSFINLSGTSQLSSFGEDFDGNLYLAFRSGHLFKISAATLSQTIQNSSFNLFRGQLLSGTIADIAASDNQYLRLRPGFVFNSSEAPVWVEFTTTSPTFNPGRLDFEIECQANTTGLHQTLEIFNYSTNSYDVLNIAATSFSSDTVSTAALTSGNMRDYVDATNNQIRARVGWRITGFILIYPWTISINESHWDIVE